MSDGFIDLRQNQAQLVDEAFWPSFTDIMTVVVMIFLIATSILIVKNWELVKELQTRIIVEQKISQRLKASMAAQQKTSQELLASQDKRNEITRKLQLSIEAERRTSEVIQKTSEEKSSLEETLAHTQSEISLMRLQLMQAGESAAERDRLIVEQDKQIAQMISEKNWLKQQITSQGDKLVKAKQQLMVKDSKLAKAKQRLVDADLTMTSLQGKLKLNTQALAKREQELEEQLVVLTAKEESLQGLSKQNQTHLDNILNYERQIASVQKKNSVLAGELEVQQNALANRDRELEELNQKNQIYLDNISDYEQQISLAQDKHSALASEYDTLEEKYNKLIRPSRSAIGKHVVEVRYERLAGKKLIRFRKSEQDQYQEIDETVLHEKLLKLKEQYKKRLYVKIIIPDNSGLSYNEAWTFMMGILDKYDYYYQD